MRRAVLAAASSPAPLRCCRRTVGEGASTGDGGGGDDAALMQGIQADAAQAKTQQVLNRNAASRLPGGGGEATDGTWSGKSWDEISADLRATSEIDISGLRGGATEEGTRQFFEKRGIEVSKGWVRRLKGTSHYISAVTMNVKRMFAQDPHHREALCAVERAAINTFDLAAYDTQALEAFYNALTPQMCAAEPKISRSNIVVMLRVGWVVFRPWVDLNVVSPDFQKIPTSRDFAKFSQDISCPVNIPPAAVTLRYGEESGKTSGFDPQAQGKDLLNKFRKFIPGQPQLDLGKMTDASCLKLMGLVRCNEKLGHYWSGDKAVIETQLEWFTRGGCDFIDVLIWEAVEVIQSVAQEEEDFVAFMTETFTYFETLVKDKKIGSYGVDSKDLYGGKSVRKHHLDIRWVMAAAEAAAANVGAAQHSLKVVGLPFNLTERDALLKPLSDDGTPEGRQTIFEYCKKKELSVVTRRPLATFDDEGKEQRYVPHDKVRDLNMFKKALPHNIQGLLVMEQQVDRLLANTVMRPASELYHTGRSFVQFSTQLNNLYQFEDFIRLRYRLILRECLSSISAERDEVLQQWTKAYGKANEDFFVTFGKYLGYMHALKSDKVLAACEESLGGVNLGDDLTQVAFNAVLATKVMTTTSVCMRSPLYLEHLITANQGLTVELPVSVMGGLFTNPETSFLSRRKDKQLTPTGAKPEEFEGKSEKEVLEMGAEKLQKSGYSGVICTPDGTDELPGFVKVTGE